MLEQYYSKLDLIQKYNFENIISLNALIDKAEISIDKLEKEQNENKNLELENLSLYNFLFSKSPQIKIQTKQTKITHKKIVMYNHKKIQSVIKNFLFDFSLAFENIKLVKRNRLKNSIIFEFKPNSKNNFVELPLPLARRIGFEVPNIKFDIRIKRANISNYKNIFPFWLF